MGRPKKYQSEQERKAAQAAYNKQWREQNPDYMKQYRAEHMEEITARNKRWYERHKEEHAARMRQRMKQWRKTQLGRASVLTTNYRRLDKKYKRGEATITPEWIIVNVFSGQCCHYCGESDWTKLGVDRIDNTKPHTPENCVPCCECCNKKKARYTYEEYLKKVS